MTENNVESTEGFITEYLKCKEDFDYFCDEYILIELPGEDVHLNMYNPQRELVHTILDKHHVLVLKSRQIGISTITKALIAWLVTFYNNVVIGIVSKDGKEATDFARDIMSMLDKLPYWMKSSFIKRTEQSFILKNGAKCYAATVNPKAPQKTLRGKSVTFLVIDEAAFIEHIDDAWTGMVSALSTSQMHARNAKVPYGTIVLSTPNKTLGVGQWFYNRYQSSVSGDDIFEPFTIHWKDIKELADDEGWYSTQCALYGYDYRKIQQELELKFLSSTGSFFDDDTSRELQEIEEKPIQKIKLFNGELWIFSRALEGAYYLIGVDTAPEHGKDKSAITVFDYETLEQVAGYQAKCSVTNFSKVVQVVASQYPGIIVVESNTYGNQVIEMLNQTQYCIRLYKETRGNIQIPGLANTPRTRPLMIDALYSTVSEYPKMVRSKRLILELIGLVTKTSGKVEAETGAHDDLALSMALCMYVRKYDPSIIIMLNKSIDHQSEFASIMNMNEIGPENKSNSAVRKYVKNNLDKMESGFIDMIDLVYGDRG